MHVHQVCAVQQGGCFAEEVVAPAAATWLLPGKTFCLEGEEGVGSMRSVFTCVCIVVRMAWVGDGEQSVVAPWL